MPDFKDLISLVRGPIPDKPLVAIWSLPPTTAGAVGGIPDMIRYYFDIDERLRIEMKLRKLLPEALILPGFWPSLGVVVEVSAFGGQVIWSHKDAPYISPPLRELKEADSRKAPQPGTPKAEKSGARDREVCKIDGAGRDNWTSPGL
jgi:hypothetical protein